MQDVNPIYTEKRECQDCYKCVRHCPVKAIKVEGGYASVMPELCVLCGHCVEVCPSHAKRVRDDLPRARALLAKRPRVLVSLAPSFVSEFPGIAPAQLIQALRGLGFHGVSETALGAQVVSAQAAAALRADDGRVLVSSACPTVVSYLQKHRPNDAKHLTALLSPLLAHCRLLREAFGNDIGIVFIGPCIAKKLEAEAHPELLEVVLTFEDLRRWLALAQLDPSRLTPGPDDRFVPDRAAEGAWYPVDGGMIAGMKASCAVNDSSCMAFSGLRAIEKALDGLGESVPDASLFLELLACEGGCVNGPRAASRGGTAAKRRCVLGYGRASEAPGPVVPVLDIRAELGADAAPAARYSDGQIRDALRLVGKVSPVDELNCAGCGYDSCRAFAEALIQRKAEREMCVTYMRKLALKKANALLQKMPAAVVIVNDRLRVIEANEAFARMFMPRGGDGEAVRASSPEGLAVGDLMPFAHLFDSVMRTGEDLLDRDLRYHSTILHVTIFSIETHAVVGAILQDVTEPAVRKAEVIRKAREVIQRSLTTTQQIACLLGESVAESEITLNSIIESFTPDRPEEPRPTHDWRKLYRR
ncbi:MAG: 4Fe-4S binding protein [Lentisphaerae bacterium]|nr:4Fe-4S binding protein [Lentisphaerota bacterium]